MISIVYDGSTLFIRLVANTVLCTTHAGHHSSHTITAVQVPLTLQAKVAAVSKSLIPPNFPFQMALPTNSSVVGAKRFRTTLYANTRHFRGLIARTKDNGVANRPTMRPSEKFSVEIVDNPIPRRSNEKQEISVRSLLLSDFNSPPAKYGRISVEIAIKRNENDIAYN